MFVREVTASVLAAELFFVPALLVLFAPSEPDANSSWQRGAAVVTFLLVLAVPVIRASGRYLLSKGLRTPLRFSLGALVLASGLVAVLVTPAIIVGSVVDLFPWASAILGGFLAVLYALVVSIPAALVWWRVAAHNQRFKPTGHASGAPGGLS